MAIMGDNISNITITDTPDVFQRQAYQLVFGVTMAIIVSVAVLGNTLVLLAIYKNKHMQRQSNYFVVSLALSDILIALLAMPYYTLELLYGKWFQEHKYCVVYHVFDQMFNMTSVINFTAISIDRCFVINYPYVYQRLMTQFRLKLVVAQCWFLGILYGTLQSLWFFTDESTEFAAMYPDLCEYTPTWTYSIVASVLYFWLPLIIMTVAYSKIYRTIQKQKRQIEQNQVQLNADDLTIDHSYSSNKDVSGTNGPMSSGQDASQLSSSSHSSREKKTPNGVANSCMQPEGPPVEFSNLSTIEWNCQNATKDTTNTLVVPEKKSIGTKAKPKRKITAQAKENKAAKLFSILIVYFLVCWTPFTVCFTIYIACDGKCDEELLPEALWDSVTVLSYTSSMINPFLYSFHSREFRKAMRGVLGCKSRHRDVT